MPRIVLALAALLLFGGCSFFDQVTSDWFGDGATAAATPTPSAEQQEVFYSAVDGLPMHFLPSGSSQVVSRLALHQRVTRIDLQRGYAQVIADNGLEGWVDNAKLLWRLPAAPAPVAADTLPAAVDLATPVTTPVEPAPADTAAEPVAPTPTAAVPVAEPSELYSPRTPTPTPAAGPTASGADPAIFDPF